MRRPEGTDVVDRRNRHSCCCPALHIGYLHALAAWWG
jgi:hypothetical protein